MEKHLEVLIIGKQHQGKQVYMKIQILEKNIAF